MYLGNWLTESTADVYVREKRNVVVEIWGQVAQKVPNLNLGPGRERRARTKLKRKGKHPLRYPQGAHHRLDHGQWWNTNLGTHQ